jgi:polyhydroxybutyrate depolymerase
VESAVAADVIRRAYTSCANRADVVLYTVHGGGHTWPGGTPLPKWFVGRTTHSIDATALMWSFFQEHPLHLSEASASDHTAPVRSNFESTRRVGYSVR